MRSRNNATVNEAECEALDLDPKEVLRIARGITRYMRMADKLGLELFGHSGVGFLCARNDEGSKVKVADLAPMGLYDGGEETWHDGASGW